jgi:DNA-binding transcriptional ArsR family regulator
MDMTAARPVAVARAPGSDTRRRIRDALLDAVFDFVGPSGPDGLSPLERELLAEGIEQALEASTDAALTTLDRELTATLRESPRSTAAKIDRLRRLVDYGLD